MHKTWMDSSFSQFSNPWMQDSISAATTAIFFIIPCTEKRLKKANTGEIGWKLRGLYLDYKSIKNSEMCSFKQKNTHRFRSEDDNSTLPTFIGRLNYRITLAGPWTDDFCLNSRKILRCKKRPQTSQLLQLFKIRNVRFESFQKHDIPGTSLGTKILHGMASLSDAVLYHKLVRKSGVGIEFAIKRPTTAKWLQ